MVAGAWRKAACAGSLLVLLLLTGCVRETIDGPNGTFTMEWWVTALTALGALLAIALAVVFRSSGWRIYILGIAGGVALVGMVPSLALDRVTVNQDGFSMNTGIWFMPNRHTIAFQDLAAIDITSKTRTSRRGSNRSFYLTCHYKNGQQVTLPVGTTMRPAAEKLILGLAEAHGIRINDLQGD